MPQPTLQEIPKLLRENYDRLHQYEYLPDVTLLHVVCATKIAFKNALRSATIKHFIRTSRDSHLLVCVSSSHLQGDVDESLVVRPNGLQDWVYPELRTMPKSEWHGAPPTRLVGSNHLTDMRMELKDFAQTVCGLLLPDPPWRAFLASAAGRTIISLANDSVGTWVERDGYVRYEYHQRSVS